MARSAKKAVNIGTPTLCCQRVGKPTSAKLSCVAAATPTMQSSHVQQQDFGHQQMQTFSCLPRAAREPNNGQVAENVRSNLCGPGSCRAAELPIIRFPFPQAKCGQTKKQVRSTPTSLQTHLGYEAFNTQLLLAPLTKTGSPTWLAEDPILCNVLRSAPDFSSELSCTVSQSAFRTFLNQFTLYSYRRSPIRKVFRCQPVL